MGTLSTAHTSAFLRPRRLLWTKESCPGLKARPRTSFPGRAIFSKHFLTKRGEPFTRETKRLARLEGWPA